MLGNVDFQGLGAPAKKKPDDTPIANPIKPVKQAKSPAWLPKWMPLAVGAAGIVIVIGILLTSKK